MIAVVAASGDPGVAALVAACATVAPTELWVPWLPPQRVAPTGSPARSALLVALGAGARLWAGDDVGRQLRADAVRRHALDLWAARTLAARRPRLVIAPSLGARRTLAAARTLGIGAVLHLDLPVLRTLHADLDRAAVRWPERRFLRRHRASSATIARQEAERVLAELVLVRGPYAHGRCHAAGVPTAALALAPRGVTTALAPAVARTGRVRLAGLATARHGLDVARQVTRARGLTLVVRVGDGTEPADLARLPGIATDDGPVDALLAPALCEAYPRELLAARRGGLPIVASAMAALSGDAGNAAPFDEDAVGAALDRALATPPTAHDPDDELTSALVARLRTLHARQP